MNETQLLSAETEEISDSTSFSALALVGFLLSLGGLFAIQYIQLMPIAILAATLGFVALMISKRCNLSFLSVGLAAAALAIASVTVSMSLTTRSLHNQYELAQAEKIGREYLEALSRGDSARVNYLIGFPLDPTDATGSYGNMESKSQRAKKKVQQDPVHVEIRERRAPAKWVFVGLDGEFKGSNGYTYKLIFRDEGQTNPPTYWLYAKKDCEKYSDNSKVHWFVDNLEAAKKL